MTVARHIINMLSASIRNYSDVFFRIRIIRYAHSALGPEGFD